jgi:2-polyprenyl-3-methyl-5-hydroxy-6-metoxy-1,4-benzoquinol methylase
MTLRRDLSEAVELLSQLAKKQAGRARGRLFRRPSAAPLGPQAQVLRERMFAYWRTLGHSDATCEMFFRDAMNADGYVDAVSRATRLMGDLRGKKILDVGCGWGGLSRVLSDRGADVTMVDPFGPHIETARARVPEARGEQGSGADLAACGFSDAQFDFVFVYSVIEHVGLSDEHRGDATPTLATQRKIIAEAARVLRPGGRMMVSTGNHSFPLDGEVQLWLFHYLPRDIQQETLDALDRTADRYGLLTWPQLTGLTEGAGLRLAHVETCEVESFLAALRAWFLVQRLAGIPWGLPPVTVTRIGELMTRDPRWMPMWHAFFDKPASG